MSIERGYLVITKDWPGQAFKAATLWNSRTDALINLDLRRARGDDAQLCVAVGEDALRDGLNHELALQTALADALRDGLERRLEMAALLAAVLEAVDRERHGELIDRVIAAVQALGAP